MSKLKRSDKLAFLGVSGDSGVTYHRLKNFTEFSVSKNPSSYTRKYVDEDFERSDVISYAPKISYSFDFDSEDAAHSSIVSITDNELIGDSALCDMVFVDLTKKDESGAVYATKRSWSVVPDKEGSDSSAYDYSGTFASGGKMIVGTATSTDSWETCTFTAK